MIGIQGAWGQDSSNRSDVKALLPPNAVLEHVRPIGQDLIVVFKQKEPGKDIRGQVWWGALRRVTIRRKGPHLSWIWKSLTYGKNYEDLFVKSLNHNGHVEILLFTTSGAHRAYLDGVQFDGKTYRTLSGEYFTHVKYINPQYLTEFITGDEGIWIQDLDKDGNMEVLTANRRRLEDKYFLNIYKWEEDQYRLVEGKEVSEEELLKVIREEGDSPKNPDVLVPL
jgi:hypothetical protein